MKIKSIIRHALVISSILGATLTYGQVLFYETFEGNTPGSGIASGATSSDGKATYTVSLTRAEFKAQNPYDTTASPGLGSAVGRIWLNTNATANIAMSPNLDSVESYVFKMGYLELTNTSWQFGINVRSNSDTTNGSYVFAYRGNGVIAVSYVNSRGTSEELTTITATAISGGGRYYLTDLGITVTGNQQQLSIAGMAIGTTKSTESSFDDSVSDQIRFWGTTTSANQGTVSFDNISVTQIPEPKTVSALVGLSILSLVIIRRIRR
ncbi:MAG: hypothetical protein LBK99_04755 [Opitutaceae bacterium]|jgi:hypothetical protein|nr:hypothetical protein [Opitutaceae bacterium]